MLAIVSPWNKKLGYDSNDNLKFLESQYVVHATFPAIYETDEIWSFKDFINYYKWLTNSQNRKHNEDSNLMTVTFIKHTYLYNNITLACIHKRLMSIVETYKQDFIIKTQRKNIKNKKWIQKFKEARGREPNEKEIVSKVI